MRNPVRTARRRRVRRQLDRIAGEIGRLYADDPDSLSFADREPLYMRHATLTRRLDRLS